MRLSVAIVPDGFELMLFRRNDKDPGLGVNLRNIRMLVVDECDQMLSMVRTVTTSRGPALCGLGFKRVCNGMTECGHRDAFQIFASCCGICLFRTSRLDRAALPTSAVALLCRRCCAAPPCPMTI